MNNIAWLLPLLGVLIFLVVWLISTTLVRAITRMSRTLDVDTGPLLRESPWGSANVNGVGINNCVKIAEYPTGWLVWTMELAGGGKLWLHKGEVQVGELKSRTFFVPQSRTLKSSEHSVRLYGPLAEFVA
jgi:hypothetical protein